VPREPDGGDETVLRPRGAETTASRVVVGNLPWAAPLPRYGSRVNGKPAVAQGMSGTTDKSVALRYRWHHLGDVRLDGAGKLAFPAVRVEPGVCRLEVNGGQASVYFGESGDLHQRFRNYRNADPSMKTNHRLRGLLTDVLANGGSAGSP
jgi:hypothetical protein